MLNIDSESYQLPIHNYVNLETDKKQIIIANTFNNDMKHYVGWLNRYNGLYQKTAAYTITKDGKIYNHYDPKYYSKFMWANMLNRQSIIILLENEGWLLKSNENNEYINWIGDIYNKEKGIVEKRWRGYMYWASYTEKQIVSLELLVKALCDKFNIPLFVVDHNTKIDNIAIHSGVFYKSNFEKFYTDPTPAWDYNMFKNKIEEII